MKLKLSANKNTYYLYQDLVKKIEKEWSEKQNAAKAIMEELKTSTVTFLEGKISAGRNSGEGKLAGSITIEDDSTPNLISIGVGNVEKMQREAPYWYVQNYGKTTSGVPYVPPPNLGAFEGGDGPVAGGSGQKWYHTGDTSMWLLEPKKAIPPLNYIEFGASLFDSLINKVFE